MGSGIRTELQPALKSLTERQTEFHLGMSGQMNALARRINSLTFKAESYGFMSKERAAAAPSVASVFWKKTRDKKYWYSVDVGQLSIQETAL